MFTDFIYTFAGKQYHEIHKTTSIIEFNFWYNELVKRGYTNISWNTCL